MVGSGHFIYLTQMYRINPWQQKHLLWLYPWQQNHLFFACTPYTDHLLSIYIELFIIKSLSSHIFFFYHKSIDRHYIRKETQHSPLYSSSLTKIKSQYTHSGLSVLPTLVYTHSGPLFTAHFCVKLFLLIIAPVLYYSMSELNIYNNERNVCRQLPPKRDKVILQLALQKHMKRHLYCK